MSVSALWWCCRRRCHRCCCRSCCRRCRRKLSLRIQAPRQAPITHTTALVLPFVAGILAVAIAADGVGAAQRCDGCDRAFSYPIFGNVERGERPGSPPHVDCQSSRRITDTETTYVLVSRAFTRASVPSDEVFWYSHSPPMKLLLILRVASPLSCSTHAAMRNGWLMCKPAQREQTHVFTRPPRRMCLRQISLPRLRYKGRRKRKNTCRTGKVHCMRCPESAERCWP